MSERLYTVRWFDSAQVQVREEQLSAESPRALALGIEARGGVVLSVTPGAPARPAARPARGTLDVAWWCRELRTLVNAGMTVVEALETLNAQKLGSARAEVNATLVAQLRQGRALSAAMLETGAFPGVLIAGVKASERTSGLVPALDDFLLYDNTIQLLRKQVVSAAIYPSVVLGLGSLITLFLLLFVVPRFSQMYADLHGHISLATRILISLSHALADRGAWVAAALGAAVAAVVAAWRAGALQRAALAASMRIAPLQRQIDEYRLAKLYQSIALMHRGGYPLDDALRQCAALGLGDRIDRGIADAGAALARGARISTAMEQAGLTDTVSLRLLSVGERTGDFDRVLQTIAERHSARFLVFVERATRIVEPVLLLLVALTVGGIVVMMYMPVFDIASSLG